MRVLAVGIEHPFDVPVQSAHDADPRDIVGPPDVV
jgi:hypothetical protein